MPLLPDPYKIINPAQPVANPSMCFSPCNKYCFWMRYLEKGIVTADVQSSMCLADHIMLTYHNCCWSTSNMRGTSTVIGFDSSLIIQEARCLQLGGSCLCGFRIQLCVGPLRHDLRIVVRLSGSHGKGERGVPVCSRVGTSNKYCATV